MMRQIVFIVAVLTICSVANVSATGSKLRSLSSMKTVVPVLKKPVILNGAWNNPNADSEAQEIIDIIAKEPEAAAPQPVDPDNMDADFLALKEAEEEAKKGGAAGKGGEEAGALGETEAAAEGAEEADEEGEEKEKSEVEGEIEMLRKLIESGRKISEQMPEKEARLAELERKLQDSAAEEARGEAQRKLDEQMILMRELDAKIDKLKRKLAEMEESKRSLQAEIDRNNAVISGGGAADAAAAADPEPPAAEGAAEGAPAGEAAPAATGGFFF
jgi:hypothetical protein